MTEPVVCDFCNKNKATHFNTEWDAMLCDPCADAEDKALEEARGTWEQVRKELGL